MGRGLGWEGCKHVHLIRHPPARPRPQLAGGDVHCNEDQRLRLVPCVVLAQGGVRRARVKKRVLRPDLTARRRSRGCLPKVAQLVQGSLRVARWDGGGQRAWLRVPT